MKKYLFCLLAFLPLCSFGAVEPVIIGFSSPNDVYTVPEGKVLLIEHIGWDDTSSPYGLEIGLELSSATSTNLLAMDNFYGAHDPVGDIVGVISFSRPLKIPENTSIRLVDVDFSSYTYTICGVLADTSDLYASIETKSEGMLCQGGMF